jgi:hypothetical protein
MVGQPDRSGAGPRPTVIIRVSRVHVAPRAAVPQQVPPQGRVAIGQARQSRHGGQHIDQRRDRVDALRTQNLRGMEQQRHMVPGQEPLRPETERTGERFHGIEREVGPGLVAQAECIAPAQPILSHPAVNSHDTRANRCDQPSGPPPPAQFRRRCGRPAMQCVHRDHGCSERARHAQRDPTHRISRPGGKRDEGNGGLGRIRASKVSPPAHLGRGGGSGRWARKFGGMRRDGAASWQLRCRPPEAPIVFGPWSRRCGRDGKSQGLPRPTHPVCACRLCPANQPP